jgi:hypothetical protein
MNNIPIKSRYVTPVGSSGSDLEDEMREEHARPVLGE